MKQSGKRVRRAAPTGELISTIEPVEDYSAELARAAADRAERDALIAIRVLENTGFLPSERKRLKRPIKPVALELMLKAAAAARLASMEQGGVRSRLSADLPSAADVHRDLRRDINELSERPMLSGREVAFGVFRAWANELAWQPAPTDAPVAVGSVSAEDALAGLATLLWTFRELGKEVNDGNANQK